MVTTRAHESQVAGARRAAAGGGTALRELRGVSLLPALATLGNLFCGFGAGLAALLAMRTEGLGGAAGWGSPVVVGCGLIFGALIFDMLDGRLARLARRTTEFGAQLDSLADIVSFGVAPVLLLLAIVLAAGPMAAMQPWVWRLLVLVCLVYLACAAIRLARFNVEAVRDEQGHVVFSGLPTPAAGAGLTALLLLHELGGFSPGGLLVFRAAMVVAVVVLAVLMISRVSYMHVLNVYLRRRRPLTHMVLIVVTVGLALVFPVWVLGATAWLYIVSGPVLAVRGPRAAAR